MIIDLIVEAAPENVELKKNLFYEVENYCSEKAILTTNTSHLKLADIFSNVELKNRSERDKAMFMLLKYLYGKTE